MATKDLIRQSFLTSKIKVLKGEVGIQEVIKRQIGPYALVGVLQPL